MKTKILIIVACLMYGAAVVFGHGAPSPPTAVLSVGPDPSYSLEMVTFSGCGSTKGTYELDYYEYDWTYNYVYDATTYHPDCSTASLEEHIFSSEGPGNYTGRIKVTDIAALSDTDLDTFTILSTYKHAFAVKGRAKSGGGKK